MAKIRKGRGRTVKGKTMTGKKQSKKGKMIDKVFKALAPGVRVTKNPHKHHGKTIRKSTRYTETRKNRAD